MTQEILTGQKKNKFKNITTPYDGYHGLNYYEEFGPGAFLYRARSEGLRDFGCSLSPQDAFYCKESHTKIKQGLPLGITLHGESVFGTASAGQSFGNFMLFCRCFLFSPFRRVR